MITLYISKKSKAFSDRENFIVFNNENKRAVESHFTEQEAQRACDIMNEHELSNNRTCKYAYTHRENICQNQ